MSIHSSSSGTSTLGPPGAVGWRKYPCRPRLVEAPSQAGSVAVERILGERVDRYFILLDDVELVELVLGAWIPSPLHRRRRQVDHISCVRQHTNRFSISITNPNGANIC
jgi:hypothetical protein